MKNKKIIDAWDKMTPSDEIKQEILTDIKQKYNSKKTGFKMPLKILATAAALIFCFILGNMLMSPQSDNIFAVKAYALERQEDGSVEMREVDLLGQTQYWHGHYDGNDFYVNINLKCEGENIKSVDFYTDDGFFAKQYLKIENGKIILEAGVPTMGRTDPDGTRFITMYGRDFEKIGNKFTLGKDDMADDLLLFLGMEIASDRHDRFWLRQLPEKMTIRAVATFNDGKTQEEILVIDLSPEQEGLTMISGPDLSPEDIREYIQEMYDTAKIADAFISEAKNHGLGEVKVNRVEIGGEPDKRYTGIWRITYNILPENGAEWIVNQSCNVQLSIGPGATENGEPIFVDITESYEAEYRVIILED